jgi:hypothetical protein
MNVARVFWDYVLPAAYAVIMYVLQYEGAPAAGLTLVDITFLIAFLYTLTDDIERAAGELGVHGIYNVVVVSWIAAIPQTVVAAYFTYAGLYTAAFLDSMVSTLIDAFLVTALVRSRYLSEVRRDWPLIIIWVAVTLTFGALVAAPERIPSLPPTPFYSVYFVIGALFLPVLFSRGIPTAVSFKAREAVNLVIYTALIMYTAYDLGGDLATWHMTESALGTIAALIATAPDLITALMIRLTLARAVGEDAGSEDAIRTMFSAAIHDQISDPALVLILAPAAAAAFPHWLNVLVSMLKLTLLDRRAFYFVGLPIAIATIALLMI